MNDVLPVPHGAYLAVFRDPEQESGIVTYPVVGFREVAGSAVVFGGPDASIAGNPHAPATVGAFAVPVVITRRGELKQVRTNFAARGPDDPQMAAPATVGLERGKYPVVEFLGVVRSNEDPSEVFADHIAAARAHAEQLTAERERAEQCAELPPREVPAEVRTAKPEPEPRPLTELLARAAALTEQENLDNGD